MRAVAWFGQPYDTSVVGMSVPHILTQTDAIIRITTSEICGSGLNAYHGYSGSLNVPCDLNHKAVGYVSEVGSVVSSLQVGDIYYRSYCT